MRKYLGILILSAAVANAETTPPAATAVVETPVQDQSLWEAGIAGVDSYVPDYPAAAQNHNKWIAAPYFVYRGRIVHADRDGARASFVRRDVHELDLGVAASFGSSSKDNEARQGMPDLDFLLEVGPRLSFTLSRLGGKGKFRLFLPVRAVFSTDLSEIKHRGFTCSPALNFRRQIGRRKDRYFISQFDANFANRQLSAYYYDVAPEFVLPERPVYDAHSGYMGSDWFTGILLPLTTRVGFFTGGQMMLHYGSANEESPLFKHHVNFAAAVGLIWTFYRSTKPGVSSD